ncbi:hypothetical protein P4S65_01455 [Pseudoalteromonas sp. B131b]|uniref:hypothetical protein n=1 Tax=unclassified Pseudoalteromonas TaxID=194690 RepID=UPI00111166D4|nr:MULTISPECIES: hypothetical protein [unclassified Pseudoalteromonas]
MTRKPIKIDRMKFLNKLLERTCTNESCGRKMTFSLAQVNNNEAIFCQFCGKEYIGKKAP